MELTHTFTVPASVEETWAALNDIESVAGCFPGAQVTEATDESFKGSVKVKLGPIALVYNGTGSFVERDDAAHRMVVDAKGKDKRGNGTAGAHVTATMAEVDGGTEVTVLTDLSITGKPAQFGRGVIQDVSDKLLGQFVECLQDKVGAAESPTPAPGPAADAPPPAEPATGPTTTEPSSAPPTDAPLSGQADPTGPAATPTARPAGRETPPRAADRGSDDALDLGATVLPILAKTYWKQGVAILALVVLVIVLIVVL